MPAEGRSSHPLLPSHGKPELLSEKHDSETNRILAIAPLLLHFLFVICIASFMLFYVDGNDFNLNLRQMQITEPDGSVTLLRHYKPLQSDVITILSAAIVVMRLFAGMWCAATSWRCIFVLMGHRGGITLQQINRTLSYGLPPLRVRGGKPTIVAIILLAAIPSQLSSPILTGSITWSPSDILIPGRTPITNIPFSAPGPNWDHYAIWWSQSLSDENVVQSAALAAVAWTPGSRYTTKKKRVLPSTRFIPLNSTLNNVTIPYFAVRNIEWIANPTSIPSRQLSPLFASGSPFVNQITLVSLLPDKWLAFSKNPNRPFPTPAIVSETRLLVFAYAHGNNRTGCINPIYGDIPPGLTPLIVPSPPQITCYLFAYVTYDAGVAECRSCRISSRTVVENTTTLTLVPDPLTVDALALMAPICYNMGVMNMSLPGTFNNINQYSLALISRSYDAAWTTLTNYLSEPSGLTSNVSISLPTSRANIMHWRVMLWMGLNFLLTGSGILFLVVQWLSSSNLVIDPSITALLLDTSELLDHDGLCKFSMLGKEDSDFVGPLKLSRDNAHPLTRKRRS